MTTVVVADGVPVTASRMALLRTAAPSFASLWGGGTLLEWRGRGISAKTAHRGAALARGRARLFHLQVDAMPDSRPILRRLGFAELATTTPFAHPG